MVNINSTAKHFDAGVNSMRVRRDAQVKETELENTDNTDGKKNTLESRVVLHKTGIPHDLHKLEGMGFDVVSLGDNKFMYVENNKTEDTLYYSIYQKNPDGSVVILKENVF